MTLLSPLAQPRTLVFLTYPQMGLLDLTGAQTVFWAATKAMAERGLQGYVLHNASLAGGLMPTAEGLSVDTVALAQLDPATIDTLVVPGAPAIEQAMLDNTALVDWLRNASGQARRTASVCSGTFLLALAGLLEGRRAATHWAMCELLKQRFPSIEVDVDAIFVQQGQVWTSAGVSAGIDLALALVEADCGREVALQVARELVVFLKRPGGQAQFSQVLQAQTADSAGFDALHAWISDNLRDSDLSVERLAAQSHMSPRNFARVYKQKTGRTPAKAIELFRMEAARRMLEDSQRSIEQIAGLCGFGDEERMRCTFHRQLAISPRDYRERFSR
ncbi:MAG: transcriptional regulator [Pseudomonadales bacterium RIFCSPLOWO2_12_60_38]|uniref:HTH araC/xylS-type domain-containing protein n=2 Tax=Pseudomonas TaxID=286 RepID=A0A3M5VEB0_PSESX|nr:MULTISPECIES: helix-turn-helix domain-containing protein [Pseudomonas]MBJ2235307.1 helix-turn-helix domain-containing protein [Pseudomonas fluorescens]NLT88263.1 helix-turn-helix domain-containing protein [Pseudomonas lactis]OHC31842.1 MAG: transcriptional regulator [Pseudomonadales bacterium RIFCSPLOWO2_12_60_38]OHC39098.1 MAG: transcriptional regulator [Pseudomonadales bacterium RIFCSPLOWO2_12_FULL_59_450]PMZ73544.1 AraC family transcriptional regulator [Pseudomonas sp. GW247-3R2A]RMU558